MSRVTTRLLSSTLLILVFMGMLLLQCGKATITSSWVEKGVIAVDGNPVEWQGRLAFQRKLNVGIGMMNNNNSLYCCIVSFNNDINRQIMGGGLTLWFSVAGKKERQGVRFPVRGMQKNFPGAMDREFNNKPDQSMQRESMLFRDIELLGPESGSKQLIPLEDTVHFGIFASIACSSNRLVYELEVPLHQTDSLQWYLSNMEKDSILVLSMKTQEMGPHDGAGNRRGDDQRMSPRGGGGGGPPPRGDGGMEMGRRDGKGGPPPGGSPGGAGFQAAAPLDVELKVCLSRK